MSYYDLEYCIIQKSSTTSNKINGYRIHHRTVNNNIRQAKKSIERRFNPQDAICMLSLGISVGPS